LRAGGAININKDAVGSKCNLRIQILVLSSEKRSRMGTAISARQQAALERLIRIAQADTGQSRMVAEFLLSWWNAPNCGGFDLTTLWGVDTEIAADMVMVFALVASCHRYPDDLGYGEEFRRIVHTWRPALQ
jgi:hypothetical protein